MLVTCPSGFAGDIRKIKGKEITKIAEAIETGDAGDMRAIIGACWNETTDPGPYRFLAGKVVEPKDIPWKYILQGDILYLLIKLRRMSGMNGNIYAAKIQCPNCGKSSEKEVSLDKLLTENLRPLSEESRRKVFNGELFETRFEMLNDDDEIESHELSFELQSFNTEERAQAMRRKLNQKKSSLTEQLAAQVRKIDGKEVDMPRSHKFFETVEWEALLQIQANFAEVDCGVDTLCTFRCTLPKCADRDQFEVDLPLGKDFFSPKLRPKSPSTPTPEGQDENI